jgi:hypothetical protein
MEKVILMACGIMVIEGDVLYLSVHAGRKSIVAIDLDMLKKSDNRSI